jgi:hypothetical protein
MIQTAVSCLVSDFLYYDRKEDEDLPRGEIEDAVSKGEITVAELVSQFDRELRERIFS